MAIGAATSLFGGSKAQSADATAAKQALTGYNYLTSGAGAPTITGAQSAGTAASGAQGDTQSTEAQLLGTKPMTQGAQNGFNNYLNSTGYQFQKQQGEGAITGSAASRGILNSGSTAKALQTYGQNTASGAFNNYLNNLSGLNTQQGATAGQGITATGLAGSAGTAGGAGAANATNAGGNSMASGIIGAGNAILNPNNMAAMGNFFGGGAAPPNPSPGLTGQDQWGS